jgi:hypothetical protein
MRSGTIAIMAFVASLLTAMVVAAPASAKHTGMYVGFNVEKNDVWAFDNPVPYQFNAYNDASTTYTFTIPVADRGDYNLLKRFFGNPVVTTIPASDPDGRVDQTKYKGPWESRVVTATKPTGTAHPDANITVTTTFVKEF